MEIKIPYLHFWSDWTEIRTNTINYEDFSYFKIENRGSSPADWWIEGCKKDSNGPDDLVNLTGHGCYIWDVIKFYHVAKSKVKTINVMHWWRGGENNAIEQFFLEYRKYLKSIEGEDDNGEIQEEASNH
jgi:hypothetical protein